MARLENWNLLFLQQLEMLQRQQTAQRLEFSWDPDKEPGDAFHCLTFSSMMVKTITGVDYYTRYASSLKYDSPLSAMKALRSLGFGSVDQLLGSIFPTKRLVHVVRGDLVMIPAELQTEESPNLFTEQSPVADELAGLKLMVAVADPPHFWAVHSAHGLVRGSIKYAVKAYDVGSAVLINADKHEVEDGDIEDHG